MNSVKKAFSNLRNYLPMLLAFVFCIIIILKSLYGVDSTSKSLAEIFANIAGSAVTGISLAMLFRMQAITDAKRSNDFKASLMLYADAKTKIEPYQDKLQSFCNYKNEQELISAKREYLTSNGISYKKYTNGEYESKEVLNALSKEKQEVLIKADKLKVYSMTPKDLLTECGSKTRFSFGKEPQSRFGESSNTYMGKSLISDVITKVLLGILFGYYTLKPLTEADSFAELMWTIFSLIVYLIGALLSYLKIYNQMIEEYRAEHIIQKTDLLNEFAIMVSKREEVLIKYNDENELIKKEECKNEFQKDRRREQTEKYLPAVIIE